MSLNLPLIALAAGAFGIGTTEFAPMGLLPVIAADLHVSIPTAGLLVTGYALGVLVGAPLLTLSTERVPRKWLLLGLMALFSGGGLAWVTRPKIRSPHARGSGILPRPVGCFRSAQAGGGG
jgi:MFS transporter, DHA1 family, inner membrane transport protein